MQDEKSLEKAMLGLSICILKSPSNIMMGNGSKCGKQKQKIHPYFFYKDKQKSCFTITQNIEIDMQSKTYC